MVQPGELGVYLYDSNGIKELSRCADEDMGAAETCSDPIKLDLTGSSNYLLLPFFYVVA